MIKKVFIDTNVIKFSSTGRQKLIPVNRPITDKNGIITGFQTHEIRTVNSNIKSSINDELRSEIAHLEKIALFAINGSIEILEDMETVVESMGLPNISSNHGRFYNAPVSRAQSPIDYSRVIIGTSWAGFGTPDELTLNFLSKISCERFLDLQKVTGAFQGKDKYNLNQLIDAFLIWSAEHNNAEYFLTLDFKLINHALKNKIKLKTKLIRPSELFKELSSLK